MDCTDHCFYSNSNTHCVGNNKLYGLLMFSNKQKESQLIVATLFVYFTFQTFSTMLLNQ